MDTRELLLLEEADRRARAYVARLESAPVFPDHADIERLDALSEPLSKSGHSPTSTIELLDDVAGHATVVSSGARYFGYVLGATLPVAAAADRIALAWDQAASSPETSPAAHALEHQAGRWLLDVLDLPRESAVGFTTSASAGTIVALATARRAIAARDGWDLDAQGLAGAPPIRVVASALAHVAVLKALRILGFGLDNVERVPVDRDGRMRADLMPTLDDRTILIVQAGEVNTGEFDPFDSIIPAAQNAGAWVHVDGAFGLWARASETHRHHTSGIDGADSWTTDTHKWLNTPYDAAVVIVRDGDLLAASMNSDAVYTSASSHAQKNLTLEFSRRARGIPTWAALRTMGRDGVQNLVDRNIALAARAAEGLRSAGFTVHNRVVLNQVLASAGSPHETDRIIKSAQRSGETWFGGTTWNGERAFRISVSSWRTRETDIDALVTLLGRLKAGSDVGGPSAVQHL